MKNKFLVIIATLVAITAFGLLSQKNKKAKTSAHSGVPTLTWDDLRQFDYKNNKVPPELKIFEKKKIKIAGYVVALTDDYTVLSDFFFVPNPHACIHDPAPPQNLIIHVKLKDSIPREKVSNPAWIEGTFTIDPSITVYGPASYKMNEATLDRYTD